MDNFVNIFKRFKGVIFVIFQINAMANRAAGKGYENTEFYDNVVFHFIGIENIHVMRQSLQKLVYGKLTYGTFIYASFK